MTERKIVKVVFQFRRGTTDEWKSREDIIPYEGEPCYDLDLGLLKIGDGKTPYKDLRAISGASMSDDGLTIVVEDLQADVVELQALVGDIPIEDQIDEALANLIDEYELQEILNSILNDLYYIRRWENGGDQENYNGFSIS